MESLEEKNEYKKEKTQNTYTIYLDNNKKLSCPPPIKRQYAFQKSILDIKTMNSIVQYLQK